MLNRTVGVVGDTQGVGEGVGDTMTNGERAHLHTCIEVIADLSGTICMYNTRIMLERHSRVGIFALCAFA